MGALRQPWVAHAGVATLTAGADSGSVTFTEVLPWTPTTVRMTVSAPENGQNLFATAEAESLSASGFDFYLNSPPDVSGYELNYVVE